ncbi:hypothetical protein Tco_0943611 [Tanacetum coccineum]
MRRSRLMQIISKSVLPTNNGLRKSKNRLKRQAPGKHQREHRGSQSESVSSLVSQDYRRKCDAAEKAYEAKREKELAIIMISFDLFKAFVEIKGDTAELAAGGVDFNQISYAPWRRRRISVKSGYRDLVGLLRCTLNEEDNVIDIGLMGATRIQNYMPFGWTEPNRKNDHTLIVDAAVTDLLL